MASLLVNQTQRPPPLVLVIILALLTTSVMTVNSGEGTDGSDVPIATMESKDSVDKVSIVIHSEEDEEEGDIEDDYSDISVSECHCWKLRCTLPIIPALPCHECKCRGLRVRSIPANLPATTNHM